MIYEINEVVKRYQRQLEAVNSEISTLESDLESLLKCRSELEKLIQILESEESICQP